MKKTDLYQKAEALCDAYDAFILDVDGTLYRQLPVQIGMGWRMVLDAIFHPSHIKNLLALLSFRKSREKKAFAKYPLSKQIACTAKKHNVSEEELEKYIRQWMFEKPLSLIVQHKIEFIEILLEECRRMDKMVIVYSDYPAEDKLEALGVSFDRLFYPGEGISNELKPSQTVMDEMMSSIHTERDRVLFIGDRDEKDGVSAQYAGIAYENIRNLK